jgi:hypothetical protein
MALGLIHMWSSIVYPQGRDTWYLLIEAEGQDHSRERKDSLMSIGGQAGIQVLTNMRSLQISVFMEMLNTTRTSQR